MSLHYIYGSAAADHLTALMDDVRFGARQQLEKGKKVCFLVPNNLKFEGEVEILKKYGKNQTSFISQLNLQVFSFERLAWYFLQDQLQDHLYLSPSGLQMLVKKIFTEHQAEACLRIFRPLAQQQNFIAQLVDLFLEWIQAQIQVEDLAAFIEEMSNSDLSINEETEEDEIQKLRALTFLYERFLQESQAFEYNNHQLLQNLKRYIQTQTLSDYCFYLYGFQRFTAEEMDLLSCLIQKAEVYCDLTMTKHPLLETNIALYAPQVRLAQRLAALSVQKPLAYFLADTKSNLIQASQNVWLQYSQFQNIQPEKTIQEQVQIEVSEDKVEEVTKVAREIYRLSRTECRYKDITIFTRNLEGYAPVIAPIFEQYGLAYHISEAKKMANHPLTLLLESLFQLVKIPNQQQAIFSLLKTELLLPTKKEIELPEEKKARQKAMLQQEKQTLYEKLGANSLASEEKVDEQIDLAQELEQMIDVTDFRRLVDYAETLCITSGFSNKIWGKNWKQEQEFQYRGRQLKKDDQAAKKILSTALRRLVKFMQGIQKELKTIFVDGKTLREIFTEFYAFLCQHKVLSRLQQQEGKEAEEVWNQWIGLLDEFLLLVGYQKYSPQEFQAYLDILLTGLRSQSYAVIPAKVDEVNVIDAARGRIADSAYVFILGGDDLHFPTSVTTNSLLTEEERSAMQRFWQEKPHIYLGKSQEELSQNEQFIAYCSLLKAEKKIYLSYNKKDGECSPYLQLFQEAGAKVYHTPLYVTTGDFSLQYISSWSQTQLILLDLAKKVQQGSIVLSSNSAWHTLITAAKKRQPQLWKALVPERAEVLASELIYDLYDEKNSTAQQHEFITSVSQLLDYQKCPYHYFLKYGLQLKEREKYQATSLLRGNFLHEALDVVVKLMQEQNYSFTSLQRQDLLALCQQALQKLQNEQSYHVYQHTAVDRNKYKKMQVLFENICAILQYELQQESINQAEVMQVFKTEVSFAQGQNYAFPDIYIPLNEEEKVHLQVCGKIDRIDRQVQGDKQYYQLIDYKSSGGSIDLTKIYNGLAMQLLTYIEILKRAEKEAQILGAYYVPLKIPKDENKIDKQWEGILTDQQQKMTFINHKKEVTTFTQEQIDDLLWKNRKQIQTKVQQIYQGNCSIEPQNQRSCEYCAFHSICHFNEAEHSYQKLRQIHSKEELLQAIAEEKKRGVRDEKA